MSRKKATYDVLDCYCNGIVMLPFKQKLKKVSLVEAQEFIKENDIRSLENVIIYAGETRLMFAKTGNYKLYKL